MRSKIRSEQRHLFSGINPARRLLENFTQGMKIPARVLLFLRRTEQTCGLRLELADIAQPIGKSNCCAERHPNIPSKTPRSDSTNSMSKKLFARLQFRSGN